MSRIGKKPVPVPAGVKIAVAGGELKIEGPKGKLAMKLRREVAVKFVETEKAVHCTPAQGFEKASDTKAYWGTTRALVANMIKGVTDGYEKTMEIIGVGWGAAVAGKDLKLTLGLAAPVIMAIPDGLKVAAEKGAGDSILVKISGPDKQAVGMFASAMRAKRKPEPYQGKGIRYQGEVIKKKQGKQFGAAGA